VAKRVNLIRSVRARLRSLERYSPSTPMLACEIGDAQRGVSSRASLTRLMRQA
jgi:hypothetical protein